MKDTKLFKALMTLSVKELHRFNKFIQSPYFNEHQGIIKLGDFLFNKIIFHEGNIPTKIEVFETVFQNQEYDDLRLRHLFSDFLKLLDKFFAVDELNNDEIQIDLKILKAYRNRSLDKHFNSYQRKLDKALNRSVLFSAYAHFQRYQLESEINDYLAQQAIKKGVNNVEATASELDLHYIINKLRYGCMQMNFRNVYDKDYKLFMLEEIVQYVEKTNFLGNPTIKIYYNILMMLRQPEEEHFFDSLKDTLYSSIKNYNPTEAKELYNFAQNYCINRINKGNNQYYKELYALFKVGLQEEILIEKGEISHRLYMNIVTVACSLKDFDWALSFMENYKSFIRPELRDNVYTYNLAQFYWHKKDYPKVLRLCARVEYDEPFYFVNSRSMMLKIYFEQDEHDALLSLGESFRIYLNRNKLLSEANKKNLWNLIKYATRLIKIKDHNYSRFLKIKDEIEQAKNVNSKAWLLEQVARIEANFAEKDA